MMGEPSPVPYDVFISYSHQDKSWIEIELLPRLEHAGLKVCIDSRDFAIGAFVVDNIEQAVENSRHTLIVLTPNWLNSQWTRFESFLVSTLDPAAQQRKLIPLLLEPCSLPRRITALTPADFTDSAGYDRQFSRLIQQLRQSYNPDVLTKNAETCAALADRAGRAKTDRPVRPSREIERDLSHQHRLLDMYTQNQHYIEEQMANFGVGLAPIHLLNQLAAFKQELAKIQKTIDTLEQERQITLDQP